MELSSVPLAIVHFWRVKRMHAELEKLTPGQLDGWLHRCGWEEEGRREWEIKTKNLLLASVRIFHAFIVAEKEFSIKQLHSYHSKDEMEKDVDDEDVEDILEAVDDTVKDGLQLGHPLDRLEWSKNTKNPQGLHHS